MDKVNNQLAAQLRDVFERLEQDITWLHARWGIYRELFGHSKKRVELLNESAPAFFGTIQDLLLDDAELGLCRLTDPPGAGKRRRLCLEQLLKQAERLADQTLHRRLRKILGCLEAKCQRIRTRRNTRVAHLQLGSALQVKPSTHPSRKTIEEALALVREFMNAIRFHYDMPECRYDCTPPALSRAGDRVVALLKDALRYQHLLRDGTIPQQDRNRGGYHDA